MVLKALKEGLKKDSDAEDADASSPEDTAKAEAKKKPDWATIRVISRYQSPMAQTAEKGMLI